MTASFADLGPSPHGRLEAEDQLIILPADEYRDRLRDRTARLSRFEQRHIQFGNLRLLVALAAIAIAYLAFSRHLLTPWWLLAPALGFIGLAIAHEFALRGRTAAQRAIRFYERGLARIEDRWPGTGEHGDRFADPHHPYSGDLDLFGRGSLFELLSLARTQRGEELLADALRQPAPAGAVLQRQEAARELRDTIDLRERIFVLGEDVRTGVDSAALVKWAESPAVLSSHKLRLAAAFLTAIAIAGAFATWQTGTLAPFLIAMTAVGAFGFWLRPRVLEVIAHVDHAVHDLELLSQLLELFESLPVEAQRLRALQDTLRSDGLPPSAQIAHLHRLAELIDSRDNVLMRVVGPPLLYGTHLAFAVERWRAHNGLHVRRWVDGLGEFEFLLSLAAYHFEHPADPFPQFEDNLILNGEDLGHPLLPLGKCVRNSVTLDSSQRMLVVSGSNMSGKSTYLRTIGTNLVLAMAGGPVRAEKLVLCPLSVGASIRVTDSLQEGSSKFYAEIKRLRQIVDLTAGPLHVLFLLDELLNGTNSHDRRIGAAGILKELLDRRAIGLVTTHDLALTEIAQSLNAANVHFEDHLEAGQLHFDYKLRPGVVQKSNALELMRSIGLDV